jgi:prephenate dehydrogenase
METVAIVGVGLIGASFGLALRKAGFRGTIVGVSKPEALEEAKAIGAIDSSASLMEACAAADLVYLSQTVDRIVETLQLLRPCVRPDVLITDAGSTKSTITQQAAKSLPDVAFIGGHPLAGKEKRGASAADATLFEGRPYVLTPLQGPVTPHLPSFRSYLQRMGARLMELTAEEHDQAAAFTSHLPQLLSTVLASTLNLQKNENFDKVYGPGLLDMTRLAMSSSDLWAAILANNQASVLTALDAFADQLAALRAAVVSNDIHKFFESGESFAASLRMPNR